MEGCWYAGSEDMEGPDRRYKYKVPRYIIQQVSTDRDGRKNELGRSWASEDTEMTRCTDWSRELCTLMQEWWRGWGGAGSRANSILVGSACTLTKCYHTHTHFYSLPLLVVRIRRDRLIFHFAASPKCKEEAMLQQWHYLRMRTFFKYFFLYES